jgi:DNA helicase II / ATP-dependent DNA helicase PcrA
LLQQHVPRYETFDVLDERRLTAFLCREEPALHLRDLTGKVFTSIKAFPENLEVVDNELTPLQQLDDPFKAMAQKFYELLEQFRLLTYGQLISRAVAELDEPDVAASVHATLAHLIGGEYLDVNPAQERLIRLLTGPRVKLCVVGDDDHAISQWRGSGPRTPRPRRASGSQRRSSGCTPHCWHTGGSRTNECHWCSRSPWPG